MHGHEVCRADGESYGSGRRDFLKARAGKDSALDFQEDIVEGTGLRGEADRFEPDALVFGHVHGGRQQVVSEIDHVRVLFVAADAVRFRPVVVFGADEIGVRRG